MGYFSNGFVFVREPNFDAICAGVPDRLARGYKHTQHAIWLLDLWQPRGGRRERWPFCDASAAGFRSNLDAVDEASRSFMRILGQLKRIVGTATAEPEEGNVQLTLAVAASAACSTFFFAADDDELDMACQAIAGSLVSCRCRLPRLSLQHADGKTTVTPYRFLEDEDSDDFDELIDDIRRLPGMTVSTPLEIEGGATLYENVVKQWPKEAGDPAQILGLGTWDPFLNLDRDFSIVFERLAL